MMMPPDVTRRRHGSLFPSNRTPSFYTKEISLLTSGIHILEAINTSILQTIMTSMNVSSSPAKSVDSSVLPSFYSSIISGLDALYIEVERFKERIGEKNLQGGNTKSLKRDILHRVIDNYIEDMFNDRDSEQNTVSKLTYLAQLCREASIEHAKSPIQRLTYDVSDYIISCVPKYIKNRIEAIVYCHTGKKMPDLISCGMDGIDIHTTEYYTLTPYNIIHWLNSGVKSYSNIYNDIEASDYPEVVKEYILAQITVFILRAKESD